MGLRGPGADILQERLSSARSWLIEMWQFRNPGRE